MSDYLTPDDIAGQLGVESTTVRDWLRSGELIGFKLGKNWRIHQSDLDRLLLGQLLTARLERANRVSPENKWEAGQCINCGEPMPEPKNKNTAWVCCTGCKMSHDTGLANLIGLDTPEFIRLEATVIPLY